jgi:hypothetical protein
VVTGSVMSHSNLTKLLRLGLRPKMPTPALEPLEREPVLIVDLPEGACRWPVREAAEFGQHLFCAAPADNGGPYCAAHLARAFRPRLW